MQREELENKSKRELYLAKYEQWKKEKENLKCVKPLREKNTHNKTLQKKKDSQETRSQSARTAHQGQIKNSTSVSLQSSATKSAVSDRNVKEVIKEVEKTSDAAQHKPSVKNEKQTVIGDGPNMEDRSEGVVQHQDEPCGGTQPHTVEPPCPVVRDADQVTLPEPVPLETHEFDPPKPVHIETNVPKTQDQLTMRDRLSHWKMNRKGTDETKNISKTRVMKRPSIHSAPNSVQKKEVSSKLHIIPKRLERRATFSVPTSKPLPGTRAGPSHRGMVRPSQTNENVKKVAPKVAKVSVRKPVLVVGAPKQRSQPGSTMRKALPHTDIKRHSLGTRRRLSAGMSKRPVGILKRKSCVPALAVKSETDIKTPSSSVGTASSCGQSHVKFLTPSQTPAQQHATFRKTPVKTKDACCDSMRQKLNSWLEAKGKTPSKFRHLMCFDAAMSERKKQDSQMKRSITVEELSLQQKKMAKEDNVCQNLTSLFEASALEDKKTRCSQVVEKGVIEQLDAILQECHHLVESGCPTDTLLAWLQSIYDNIPQARHYTPFYRCKVDTVKRHGCPADTIEVMAQAISNSAQPPSDLAALHTSIVTEMVTMATNQAVIIDTAEQGGPEGADRTEQDTLEDMTSQDDNDGVLDELNQMKRVRTEDGAVEDMTSQDDNDGVLDELKQTKRVRTEDGAVEDMTSQDDNDGVLDELKQTKRVRTEDGAVEDMTSQDDNDGVLDELKQTKRVRTEESAVEAPFSIHYCVANVTPFQKRKRAASISTPQPTQSVVTPVRRSTRRSVQNNVTDSEKIIRSISDLSEQEKTTALFRPNHALDDVLEKFA